jgi:hypothetical protein
MNQHANRHFRLNYHDDASGGRYVARACGADVGRAYKCLAAGQLRADLFRFCATWSEGGLYLDSDLVSNGPIDALYAPCAALSVGIDGPTGEFAQLEQAQMKVLAARRGSLTARCMVDAIVARVIERWTPSHPANILNLSGPALLAQCCRRHAADEWIVRTYEDRRNGAWPHTGMLGYTAANTLGVLAWETPSAFHFPSNPGVRDDYTWLSREGLPLYTDTCELPFADSRGVA